MESDTIKNQIIEYIKTLPDEISLEELMYHLYAKEKILLGLRDADEGKLISNEEAGETIQQWFK
jgi:hypothetical protein